MRMSAGFFCENKCRFYCENECRIFVRIECKLTGVIHSV